MKANVDVKTKVNKIESTCTAGQERKCGQWRGELAQCGAQCWSSAETRARCGFSHHTPPACLDPVVSCLHHLVSLIVIADRAQRRTFQPHQRHRVRGRHPFATVHFRSLPLQWALASTPAGRRHCMATSSQPCRPPYWNELLLPFDTRGVARHIPKGRPSWDKTSHVALFTV